MLLGEFYLEIDPGTPESIDPLTRQPTKNYLVKNCFEATHKENCNQITNVVEAITTTDVLADKGSLMSPSGFRKWFVKT